VNTTGTLVERLSGVATPAEQRVANYFLVAGPRAAAMSAREIADAVGTSDATVLRATKSLGFASLRDLRRALSEEGREPELTHRLRATIDQSRSAHDVLSSAVDRHLQSLGMLTDQVRAGDFDSASLLLAGASTVWWSGTGPSAYLAEYAAFLSRRLGRHAGTLTHSGADLADELLPIRSDNCIVVLAYGHIHPHVKVILQHAAALETPVILITDAIGRHPKWPVAVNLHAGRGVPGLFASHATTVVLIEALVLALAAAAPVRSEEALRTLNSLRRSIAGRQLDVDPP
jgi:DNA-binding MurR/RpiR family transcriptional regulator